MGDAPARRNAADGNGADAAAGSVTMLPGFAEGQWWVQDAAAALPARLLGDVAGKSIADLCAAPGGKTAQLAQAGARVTAVDRSPGRMARLRDNLARLSLEAETVVADAAEWQGGKKRRRLRRHPDRRALLPRPAPSGATPMSPGCGRKPTSAPLTALQKRLLQKAVVAAQAGRDAGLLYLFAGTGRRRAGHRGPSRHRACGAPRADRRPARSRASRKS